VPGIAQSIVGRVVYLEPKRSTDKKYKIGAEKSIAGLYYWFSAVPVPTKSSFGLTAEKNHYIIYIMGVARFIGGRGRAPQQKSQEPKNHAAS
jgi:hypothetical protein